MIIPIIQLELIEKQQLQINMVIMLLDLLIEILVIEHKDKLEQLLLILMWVTLIEIVTIIIVDHTINFDIQPFIRSDKDH